MAKSILKNGSLHQRISDLSNGQFCHPVAIAKSLQGARETKAATKRIREIRKKWKPERMSLKAGAFLIPGFYLKDYDEKKQKTNKEVHFCAWFGTNIYNRTASIEITLSVRVNGRLVSSFNRNIDPKKISEADLARELNKALDKLEAGLTKHFPLKKANAAHTKKEKKAAMAELAKAADRIEKLGNTSMAYQIRGIACNIEETLD